MIFVTGGTGLLGNCIVRELCRRGEPVRVLVRHETSLRPFDDLKVEIVRGDLGDDASLFRDAVAGCRAVIHSAALIHIGWQQLEASRRINVQGSQHVIDACLQHNIRLVHVSTVDTLPAAIDAQHPISEIGSGGVQKVPCSYVISKSEAESLVRKHAIESGLDTVITHPGFMLGPYDWKPSSGRMMLEIYKFPLVVAPRGGCSVCDARDVASGIVNAVDRGRAGQNYILAGENLTYQDLWKQMLAASSNRKKVHRFGPFIEWFGTAIDICNRWLPIHEGDVNGATIRMGNLNHYYQSDLAKQELGYANRPLATTLAEAWDWLKTEHLDRPATTR